MARLGAIVHKVNGRAVDHRRSHRFEHLEKAGLFLRSLVL
jgi:hypothetical protein